MSAGTAPFMQVHSQIHDVIAKARKALGLYVIEQPLVKCIAVLTWGKAGHALIGAGKIVAVGEAEGTGDVTDRLVGVSEHEACGIHFLVQNELL